MITGKQVKLTKLEDTKFDGNHPNKMFVGIERTGIQTDELVIGRPFIIYGTKLGNGFCTSHVTKINDDNTFNTENSLYKIEILENETSIK